MSWPLLGWCLCRRSYVFNLYVWHASVCFCASLYKLLQEFHQSYNSGAVGDGDELIGFLWGQRSRSWREQIWTKVLILNHFVAVLRYVIITLVGLDVSLVILQFLPECGYVTFGSLLSQSVCRLSVTFVRHTEGVENCSNISTPFCTLAIRAKFYGDRPGDPLCCIH